MKFNHFSAFKSQVSGFLLALCLCVSVVSSPAGITGTNLITYGPTGGASTNNGNVYVAPGTYAGGAQTFFITYTNLATTNAAIGYYETSLDGGNSWTTTATWRPSNTNGTTATWAPSLSTLSATNRFRLVTTNNSTLGVQATWIQ